MAAFVGAFGMLLGAKSSYDSGVQNAEVAENNARQERDLTMEQVAQADRQEFLRIGEMRAAAGASGATGGSFTDVMADSAAQLTLQKQSIQFAGAVNTERLLTGAAVQMAKGQNALLSGSFGAAGTLGAKYAGNSNNTAGSSLVNAGSGSDGAGVAGGSDYPG
jgi:hypothetical protein